MAGAQRRVWRKHVYVLLASTSTQWLQILFTLAVLVFDPVAERALNIRISSSTVFGTAVVICGLWTTVHLNRGARAQTQADGERTALARRQALLSRLSSPVRKAVSLTSTILTIIMIVAVVVSGLLGEEVLWVFIGSYYVFLLAWLGIEILDWYNDQYILTEDRIIDITRLPIIYEQRTEAPLAMVQNASTAQRGIGVLLNFGNVQVETAGYARPILFENVWRPRQIQEQIFEQIDALRAAGRREQEEAQERQTQRWFEAYHTLASGIREIRYNEAVAVGRPIHVQWEVRGPEGRPYRTWLEWDTESRAGGGDYANRQRPHGRPWYRDDREWDGSGSGRHSLRGIPAPYGLSAIYCRVALWFEGERQAYSSPELTIAIREPAQV